MSSNSFWPFILMSLPASHFNTLKAYITYVIQFTFDNENELYRNYTRVLIFFIEYCLVCIQQQTKYIPDFPFINLFISIFLCIDKPSNNNLQVIISWKFTFMIMTMHFLLLWQKYILFPYILHKSRFFSHSVVLKLIVEVNKKLINVRNIWIDSDKLQFIETAF